MPLMEIHLIENAFNPEQKRQIIQKLTDAMGVDRRRKHARRELGQNFRSHERRMGHQWPAADHRSGQGSRSGPKRGVRPVRGLASPGGSSPHL